MTQDRRSRTDQRRTDSAGNRTLKIMGTAVIALLLIAIVLLATGVVKMSPLTGQ